MSTYITLPPINNTNNNIIMQPVILQRLSNLPLFKRVQNIKLNIYIKTNKTGKCHILLNNNMLANNDPNLFIIPRISLPKPLYTKIPAPKNKIWDHYDNTIQNKLQQLFKKDTIITLPDPEYPDDPDSDKKFILDREPAFNWRVFPLSDKYSKYKFFIYPIYKNYLVLEQDPATVANLPWPPQNLIITPPTRLTGPAELHINILVEVLGDWVDSNSVQSTKKENKENKENKNNVDPSGSQPSMSKLITSKTTGFCKSYFKNLKDIANNITGNNKEKEFYDRTEKRELKIQNDRSSKLGEIQKYAREREFNIRRRGKWICKGGRKKRRTKKGKKKRRNSTRKNK